MTIAQLPVTTSNETAVATYVAQIKKYIGDATHSWRQIADIFASAEAEFGFTSDKMKSLMKQTGFSKSKTSKLISISKSKRLRNHYNTFRSTEAWTVLYEVTKLTDEEFQNLIRRLGDDEIVTQSQVNSAKTKIVTEVDPYKTVFSIQIDINAIKSQMFSGHDYEKLIEAVETIQNTMNYIRVSESNLIENDAARFLSEINREYNRKVRETWNKARKDFISHCKCDRTILELKEDIQSSFKAGNYDLAFSFIGFDDFDQNKIMNDATRTVYEIREMKFGLKANSSDAFANTEIKTAA